MKILSPIDNAAEAGALIDAGADELYGGYVPSGWKKKFSMLGSVNQRYFESAQIENHAGLSRIIKTAHGGNARFFLTLNAPSYIEEAYPAIIGEAERMHGMGVDAFIVADIGLILRMKDALPDAEVHLSTMSSVFNSEAAAFFARMGITRMVFPRELTLSEMKGITRANPGVEFDAFVMIGKCPNIEGFCSFTHNDPGLCWPCEQGYDISIAQGGTRAEEVVKAQKGWSMINRRQACGLCALPGLKGAGVTALKLVGRGGSTSMKVRVIEAVREMLGLAGQGVTDERLKKRAKGLYRELFGGPCSAYVCYFPGDFAGR